MFSGTQTADPVSGRQRIGDAAIGRPAFFTRMNIDR
jgi:hypothetical protein